MFDARLPANAKVSGGRQPPLSTKWKLTEMAAFRPPHRSVGVLERGHGGGGGEATSYVQPHWGHTVTPVAITAPHARHSVSSQITTVPHASQRKADIRSISTRSLPGAQKNKLITPGPGLILPGPEEAGSSISRPERCSMPNRPQTIFALQVGHFIIRYVCHVSCTPNVKRSHAGPMMLGLPQDDLPALAAAICWPSGSSLTGLGM